MMTKNFGKLISRLGLPLVSIAISVGTISISLRAQAQNVNHDYVQAFSLAMSAIDSCYTNKNLQECDKLTQIKNTLMSWCQKSNNIKSDACVTYKNVIAQESFAMSLETAKRALSN